MKRLILILAPLALAGCDFHRSCGAILQGAATAQEIADVLVRNGVAVEIAAKVGNALAIGQIPLSAACAAIPASPVAVPGQ